MPCVLLAQLYELIRTEHSLVEQVVMKLQTLCTSFFGVQLALCLGCGVWLEIDSHSSPNTTLRCTWAHGGRVSLQGFVGLQILILCKFCHLAHYCATLLQSKKTVLPCCWELTSVDALVVSHAVLFISLAFWQNTSMALNRLSAVVGLHKALAWTRRGDHSEQQTIVVCIATAANQ